MAGQSQMGGTAVTRLFLTNLYRISAAGIFTAWQATADQGEQNENDTEG